MSSFTIGDLVIPANGEDGSGLAYNLVKAWYDVEQDQQDSDPRPGQDGSFSADETYSSQATPSIEGVFAGADAAEAVRMKMRLRALKAEGRRVPLVWDDHGFITRRMGFVHRVTPSHSASRPGFKFAIDFSCPDPALYGPERLAGPATPISRGDGGLRFDQYTGVSYSWVGATGASPSIETKDGVEARRNRATNPLNGQSLTNTSVVRATSALVDDYVRATVNDVTVGAFGSRLQVSQATRMPVTPGETLRVAVDLRHSQGHPMAVQALWHNSAGTFISSTTLSQTIPTTADSFSRFDGTVTVPADMASAWFYIGPGATARTVGDTFDIRDLMIGPGTYFDGSTVGTGAGPGLVFPETYGTLGSDGRLTVINNGTASTYSVFTFRGGSSEGFSFTQISTGRTISVARELPEGSEVQVDMRSGRVTLNGSANDISGSLRSDDWWATAPMTSEQVQLGIIGTPYGTPTLTATTSDAY